MFLSQQLQPFEGQIITQTILMNLLKDYHWPHNKISDMVKQEILTPLKRGVFITGPKLKLSPPSSFLIANHLYGPSYVSVEAALSHWGLIPEKVVNVESMTTGKTKSFSTDAGFFSYRKITLPYYSYGISRVQLSQDKAVLMASREKAICDIVVTRAKIILRSSRQVLDFFLDDLRIERSELVKLNNELIKNWVDHAPKTSSIKMLTKTLDQL